VSGCNDAVESKFAAADFVMRTYRGISVLNASGIVQQRTAHDFDRPLLIVSDRRKRKAKSADPPTHEKTTAGFFWSGLNTELRHSLVGMVRAEPPHALKVGRGEKHEHDIEKMARREEAVQKLLNATVERYAAALELYDVWANPEQSVRDAAALEGMTETEQIAELRRQIEMRTVGLGWTEFETKWGYSTDAKKEKVADLRRMLVEDILPHEAALRRLKKLPKAAVPPQLKPRALKVLGTEDADALRLEAENLFNLDSLLPKVEAARSRREAQGISDRVEIAPPREAPAFDTNLVGKRLEVCWPYKENGKTVKIWASGTVKRVADGLTDARSKKAQKVLPAGAILWAWDADPDYKEVAGEKWLFLLPKRWNKHVQYAWRYDPCELGVRSGAKPPPAAPRVECGASDDDYLTE